MIALLFFGLGAMSLATQAIMVREFLVVVHGTELCFGLLFASWLVWIGVGAAVGTGIASRAARPRVHLGFWVAVGALSPILQIEIVRHARRWLAVPVGLTISWHQGLLLALVATAPFCLMIGATFPLGCASIEDRTGRGVGRLYMVEAVGAMAGGLVFAFLLAGRVGHFVVLAAAGAGVVAAAAMLQGRAGRRAGFGMAAILSLATPLVGAWDTASEAREQADMMPGQTVEAVFETPYEKVAIGRMEDQLTIYGDGVATATVPDPYETPAVVYNVLAQQPDPKRVLVLGNPATGLAAELVRALDGRRAGTETEVTFVHPDERQIRALAARLPAAETAMLGSRVHVAIDDPRAFVRSSGAAFDLIFVDAPEPTATYVNRLYTAEFFAQAARAMSPAGVVCFRLTSASAYVGREVSELAASVLNALEQTFPNVVVTPGEQSYFFASMTRGAITGDAGTIDARLRAFPGAAPHRAAIVLAYDPDQQRRLREMLSAGRGAIANSDHHPSSAFYGSVLWERWSSETPSRVSRLTRALGAVESLGPVGVAAGVGMFAAAWLAARRARRERATEIDAAVSVLVAGFAAMAANLVLLSEYQSACGALYQRLALMSALFMLGIAVGTQVVGRWERPAKVVSGVLFATALFDLLLARLLGPVGFWPVLAQQAAYAFLFCAAGTCLGMVFPPCAEELLRVRDSGQMAGRAGGILDATDHLGAALGALVTGTLILPAVGAASTLSFVALLAAMAGVMRLVLARRA